MDASWSATSDIEDDSDTSKESRVGFEEDGGSGSSFGGSESQEFRGPNGQKKPPQRNNYQATEVSESEDDDEQVSTIANTEHRSPAPSRRSYDYDYEEEEAGEYEEDEELMEIKIETLTGTTFRVRVSSKETAVGLKSLLYRTEGKKYIRIVIAIWVNT